MSYRYKCYIERVKSFVETAINLTPLLSKSLSIGKIGGRGAEQSRMGRAGEEEGLRRIKVWEEHAENRKL